MCTSVALQVTLRVVQDLCSKTSSKTPLPTCAFQESGQELLKKKRQCDCVQSLSSPLSLLSLFASLFSLLLALPCPLSYDTDLFSYYGCLFDMLRMRRTRRLGGKLRGRYGMEVLLDTARDASLIQLAHARLRQDEDMSSLSSPLTKPNPKSISGSGLGWARISSTRISSTRIS